MVEHKIDLICKCGYCVVDAQDSDYRYSFGQKRFPFCPHCDTVMKHKVSGISNPGDYRHTSDSLAIHPDDIPAHRKLFPGIEVTSQGQPKFTSPKQQAAYALKSAGCYKKPQKRKRHGRRIA